MSITLIRPPFCPTGFDQQFQEPLNLAYLAAVLRREGFEVHLLDAEFAELTVEAILREVAADAPSLVGISVMSDGSLPGALRIAEGVRRWAAPESHVTAGGHFATFRTEYLLRMVPEMDSVVLFEGETAIVDLARLVLSGDEWHHARGIAFLDDGRGVSRTARADPVVDLDTLPFPARDLLPKAIRLGLMPAVLSSRGCSGACSFCSIHRFVRKSSGRAWRGRSPGNVVAEVRTLVENFRVGEVGFLDDDFIGTRGRGRQRARAIAERLTRERLDVLFNLECRPDMIDRETFSALREAGLRSVFLGVEAVAPEAVRTFNKGVPRATAERALKTLDDLDIQADVGFILYHPYVTMEEIWEGYSFLKAHGQLDVHTALNRMFVTPGAPIRERLIDEGRLAGEATERSLGAETYDWIDPRVGDLLAVLHVAVFPLFRPWYNGLKEYRRVRSTRKFATDERVADDRMKVLWAYVRSVDEIVQHCFEEAYAVATRPRKAADELLTVSRRLRDEAMADIRALARRSSCEAFLTADCRW